MSRLVKAGGALTALGLAVVGFLHDWEGIETLAYPDPVSRGEPWTICVGETERPDGTRVRPGDTDTKEGCLRRLTERLVTDFEPGVVRCIGEDVAAEAPGGLYLSMIEGAYNYGIGAFCKSTAAKRAKARDWRGACEALTWYVKAGGKTIKGLQNRRKAAFDICIADIPGVEPKKITRSRTALNVDKPPVVAKVEKPASPPPTAAPEPRATWPAVLFGLLVVALMAGVVVIIIRRRKT